MCKDLRPDCKITTMIFPPTPARAARERLPVRPALNATRPKIPDNADKKTIKMVTQSARSRRMLCALWMSHRDLWRKETWMTIRMRDTREAINKSEGAVVSVSIFLDRMVVQRERKTARVFQCQWDSRRHARKAVGVGGHHEGAFIYQRHAICEDNA